MEETSFRNGGTSSDYGTSSLPKADATVALAHSGNGRLARSGSEGHVGSPPADNIGGAAVSVVSSIRRKMIFACLAFNSILVMICIAVMVPFFPLIAAEKDPAGKDVGGATAIGFVFSISPLAEFLAAPLVGRIIPHSGPKTVLLLGGVLVGGSLAIFGFVDRIDQWSAFLILCYCLRAVQGIGTAFNVTATFAVLVGIFPNNVSLVAGSIRAFNSLGFTVGPAMAGGLYEASGFLLPFIVHGGLMLAGTVWILFALPSDGLPPPETHGNKMIKDTLVIPWSLVWLISIFLNGFAQGMLEPNVSPFLEEKFGLSPSQVGLVYLFYAGVLAIGSPIVGVVADRWVNPKKFLAPSLMIIALALVIIGPWEEMKMGPALWRTMFALGLTGLGSAMCITCTTPGVLNVMHEAGYTDSLELHSNLGGIVTAFFAGGIALGPTLGSTAVAAAGFQNACAYFGAAFAFASLAGLAIGLWQDCKPGRRRRYDLERQPLLPSK